jgi:Flp pilus assembly protein protease CpaA
LAVCIGVVDIEHRRVPNALIVALAAVMGSWRALSGAGAADMAAAVVVAVAVLVAFLALNWAVESLSGAELLGPADSKLLAAAAVGFVPWQLVIFLGLVGLVATVFGLVWQAVSRRPEFPLGPSFAAAFLICLANPGLSVRFGL